MSVQVSVEGEIRLDSFLKWARVASTGGQGKALVLAGLVKVNGEVETRRGRLLRDGDLVRYQGFEFIVRVTGKG